MQQGSTNGIGGDVHIVDGPKVKWLPTIWVMLHV
jgi:hypothetical protein